MNILMVTNTYAPHVGGVARSVHGFTEEFRRRGHRVLVVAPMFDGAAESDADVIRVRAIQNFNGSDFSLVLATPKHVLRAVAAFAPDIVHSHHPFLLGATAVRLARTQRVPLVFTHHTLYEHYTHYVPGDSDTLKRFVVRLSTNYANLSGEVFAPSKSIADLLQNRQVKVPIQVVPTGVNLADFEGGSGDGLRIAVGIPLGATVVGHVGRLAEEKNPRFLAQAMAGFLAAQPNSYALVVGDGSAREDMAVEFWRAGALDRVRFAGTLQASLLVSAYKAMDVFAFASTSETQGMVLTEAMAAGVPVVAIDASGVRDVVRDRVNGRLVPSANLAAFVEALTWVTSGSRNARSLAAGARRSAEQSSTKHSADRALARYRALAGRPLEATSELNWRRTARLIRAEWDIISATMGAASRALQRRPQEG